MGVNRGRRVVGGSVGQDRVVDGGCTGGVKQGHLGQGILNGSGGSDVAMKALGLALCHWEVGPPFICLSWECDDTSRLLVKDKQGRFSWLNLLRSLSVVDHHVPDNVDDIVRGVGSDDGVVGCAHSTRGWDLDQSQHHISSSIEIFLSEVSDVLHILTA